MILPLLFSMLSLGGPLSPCPNKGPFYEGYRYTNGLVHRGCATGYSQNENLDGGGSVVCGGRLDDTKLTMAVSINVPILNKVVYENGVKRTKVRCGLKVKVCGLPTKANPTGCIVSLVNDRGPYITSGLYIGGDYGRDFDMSVATRKSIGISTALAYSGDPLLVWWKVCAPHTPVGATRCSL